MSYNIVLLGASDAERKNLLSYHHDDSIVVDSRGNEMTRLTFKASINDRPTSVSFSVAEQYGDTQFPPHAFIVLFDLTDDNSWKEAIATSDQTQNTPVVLCGTNYTIGGISAVSHEVIVQHLQSFNRPSAHLITYFDINTSSGYNIEKPFLYTWRQIVNPGSSYCSLSNSPLNFV